MTGSKSVKRNRLVIYASIGAILLSGQGCVKFPEDDTPPMKMEYSGVRFSASELMDNEPVSEPAFAAKVRDGLKKLTCNGEPLELNDTGGAAVEIKAFVKTHLIERVSAPGLDQGRYGTTLSVKFTSVPKNVVFFEDSVSTERYASTPAGAAEKGAEWAADHFLKNFINEQFYRHIPISKFPKKKAEKAAPSESES